MDREKSAEVIPSLVGIAKLVNGVVELNEEQLKAISPEIRDYPVAVISVIGGTEEGRGAVVKALVGCLYKEEATDGLIANESKRKEVDAIFAVFPPGKITNEFGMEIAVLILDISGPHSASLAYSKLANLCLLVSSMVIYTASCNRDEVTNINMEMSELKSVEQSFLNINRTWIIVQDCHSSHSYNVSDARLLAAEYENLGLSERTKEEVSVLARYSHYSAMRILLTKRSNNVEVCPLQGYSAESNLTLEDTCRFILKTVTQIEGVALGFIMPYFRLKWCQAEGQVAQESYASAAKRSALLGDRAATCSSRGRGRGRRPFLDYQCQDLSTTSKSSAPMKSADVKPIAIDFPNEMSGNEHKESMDFEQRFGFGVSTVLKKTSTDQGMEKYSIRADGCMSERRGTDNATVGTQTHLAALTLSKENDSVNKLRDVSLEAGDRTVEIVQEPEPMEVDTSDEVVSLYREFIQDFIGESSSPPFREIQKELLDKLQSTFPIMPLDLHKIEAVYEDICQRNIKNMQPHDTYQEISEKMITPSANSAILKMAVQYSSERYTELMGAFVLPHNIYTVKYIKEVHDFAYLHVLEAFSFGESTLVFEKAKKKLHDTLSASLQERLEANFAMMRKLDKTEEKLRRMCGVYYNDKMSAKMSEKTVSSEKAQEIHEEAMHATKQWFSTQCKDVIEPIKGYWEKVLDVKFEFWKTYYMDEFGVKQDLPHVAGCSLSAKNEQPMKTANVGIYFGPDLMQFGLYSSDIETFNQSCVEILPLICIKDEKILIGDEAKNCKTRIYNVFDIISRPTDVSQRKSVKLYAKNFNLTSNEIAVLFFHEAKKKFESSVKTEVGTCAVAASGLLPSASKQGLITALRMSGFRLVKFIPSTTAILVWYVKWRLGQSCKNTKKDPRVLVIHHTGPLVEVVKGEISAGHHLKLRKIGGFLNYNDFKEPRGERVVEAAIREAIFEVKRPSRDFERTIIIHGSQGDVINMELIQDIAGGAVDLGYCEVQSYRHILFSAAAYDADNNGDKSVSAHWPRFPTFNHLFPHKLSIEISSCKTIIEFHPSGTRRYSVTLRRNESSFTVCESIKTPKMVFCYPCSYAKATRSSPEVVFDLNLTQNGTFEVCGPPLTCPNFQFISDFDLEYVKKKVAEVIHEKERFMEKSKAPCHTDTLKEKAAEDPLTLKATLRNQLKDAKERLEVSGSLIKPMILEGINDRIKACEKLLSQPSVKEKQLNIAIGQLKVAASRIPSTN